MDSIPLLNQAPIGHQDLENKRSDGEQKNSTLSMVLSLGRKVLLVVGGLGIGYLAYRYFSSTSELQPEKELQQRDVKIFKDGTNNSTLNDVSTDPFFRLDLKDKYKCLVPELKEKLQTERGDLLKDCYWGDRTPYCRKKYIDGLKNIHQLKYTDIPEEEAKCYLKNIERVRSNNLYPTLLSGDNYEKEMSEKVSPIWNVRQNGFVQSNHGKNVFLHWTCLRKNEHERIIVLIQGRTETDNKYQEVMVDLYKKGFDVCTFSNRGQGESTRFNPKDHEMHGVDKFRYMIDDAEQMTEFFNVSKYKEKVLLGHSMGGLIASRLMQTPGIKPFDKLVLTSPAVALELPAWQQELLKVVGNIQDFEGNNDEYGLSQGPWQKYDYQKNELSNSRDRFEWWQNYQENHPDERVGGMSAHCLEQLVSFSQITNTDAEDIKIPTLIIQPQQDTSINEAGIKDFCGRIPQCQLTEIDHAQHEILMEDDFPRGEALVSMFEFLQKES